MFYEIFTRSNVFQNDLYISGTTTQLLSFTSGLFVYIKLHIMSYVHSVSRKYKKNVLYPVVFYCRI